MTLAVSIAQSGANNVTMRNRIINGQMQIDQRNAGASQSFSVNTSGYTVDRFVVAKVNGWGNGFTTQQVTDAPAGFIKSLKVTQGASADSTASNTYSFVSQVIEGYNWADLGWGTANAKAVTVSFWVKSSLTGTFSFAAYNSGAQAYVTTYSLPTANTWTYITLTVPGPTSGTFNTDNTNGIQFIWGLGINFYTASPNGAWQSGNILGAAGATVLWTTANATYNITGVQIEAGTTATPFEQRLYGTELALCQRYCQAYRASNAYDVVASLIGMGYTTALGGGSFQFKQEMRAAPTMTKGGNWRVCNYAAGFPITNWVLDSARTSNSACEWNWAGASGLTAGAAYYLQTNNDTTAYFVLSAEL